MRVRVEFSRPFLQAFASMIRQRLPDLAEDANYGVKALFYVLSDLDTRLYAKTKWVQPDRKFVRFSLTPAEACAVIAVFNIDDYQAADYEQSVIISIQQAVAHQFI